MDNEVKKWIQDTIANHLQKQIKKYENLAKEFACDERESCIFWGKAEAYQEILEYLIGPPI